MIDYLVNNIGLLQLLTMISATITILLEIYFIMKNIKKKYEKSIENNIKQEIITKPIYDVCDSNIILQRYFGKKMKDSLMELEKGNTRKHLEYLLKKKYFLRIYEINEGLLTIYLSRIVAISM